MPVKACPLPADSALHTCVARGDFLDCYCVDSPLSARPAAEIIVDFPGWAQWLLGLRNLMVAPFGLAAEAPAGLSRIGIFPIVSETVHELIAGFDDRHLDFRVAVLARDGRVHLATWVRPHNMSGRMYLRVVMPFHILIVRNALARVGRAALANQPPTA